ncbi:MAG: Flp family type IVb pilin [Armatimonadota bacterium]
MGMLGRLIALMADEAGMSSAEYALMLALVSLAALVGFGQVSDEVQYMVDQTSQRLREASGMGCS